MRTALSRPRAVLIALFLGVGRAFAAPIPEDKASIVEPEAPLNEEVLSLPGDPDRPVTMQVTLYKPTGPGPFPLAVMNHGATNANAHNRGDRYRFTFSAYYFLSRGYAVALPMARGFAGSGGDIFHAGCDDAAIGRANARDVIAVIAALRRRPDIDGSRIVVAGQSFGGWTALALLGIPASGARGAVLFSPALRASDCHAQDSAMVAAAGRLGAATTLPSVWFYGENDTVMPTDVWHRVFDAFHAANAAATLVDIGPFMRDSHQMLSFPEGLPKWAPAADALLARAGLPARPLLPGYLPPPPPPPVAGADLNDGAAVPFLDEKGRAAYQHFLTVNPPRAFVIGPNGFASTDGGFDPLARALKLCASSGIQCRPYAYDSSVIWAGGDEHHAVQAVAHPGQPLELNFAVAINPDCSPRRLPTLAIVASPAHGTAAVRQRQGNPSFPPANPYAHCNATPTVGEGVVYTPAADFRGDDALSFAEGDDPRSRRVYDFRLTVR